MSRSNMYAEVADLTPVLAMMNEHANQGLPFISLEYGDDYLEWTQEGEEHDAQPGRDRKLEP